MKKFSEKFANIFSAVSFAEQGEWDDAVKMADGSFKVKAADGKQVQATEKKEKRVADTRPRLRL